MEEGSTSGTRLRCGAVYECQATAIEQGIILVHDYIPRRKSIPMIVVRFSGGNEGQS